jgi:hypothetical protein
MADQVLVFLSHTQGMRRHPEGESFLDGAERAVNAIDGAKALHMEFFPASDVDPAATSVKHLRRADIFLAIIGFDYGTPLRDDPSRSFTELEFDTATQLGMERLVFMLKPEAAGLQQLHAANVSAAQARFRKKLEDSGATVAYFNSVGDLKFRITQALNQSLAERRRKPPPGPTSGPTVPSAKTAGRFGCAAATLMLTLIAAIVFGVWTAVAGSFPPWEGQQACAEVEGRVIATSPESFGTFEDGAVLDIEIVNRRSQAVTIPASRNAVARGAGGRQYAPTDSLSDGSWFFDVEVQGRSSARVQLGIAGDGGSDTVTVEIPGVRGSNPLIRCRLVLPAVDVAFAG